MVKKSGSTSTKRDLKVYKNRPTWQYKIEVFSALIGAVLGQFGWRKHSGRRNSSGTERRLRRRLVVAELRPVAGNIEPIAGCSPAAKHVTELSYCIA